MCYCLWHSSQQQLYEFEPDTQKSVNKINVDKLQNAQTAKY